MKPLLPVLIGHRVTGVALSPDSCVWTPDATREAGQTNELGRAQGEAVHDFLQRALSHVSGGDERRRLAVALMTPLGRSKILGARGAATQALRHAVRSCPGAFFFGEGDELEATLDPTGRALAVPRRLLADLERAAGGDNLLSIVAAPVSLLEGLLLTRPDLRVACVVIVSDAGAVELLAVRRGRLVRLRSAPTELGNWWSQGWVRDELENLQGLLDDGSAVPALPMVVLSGQVTGEPPREWEPPPGYRLEVLDDDPMVVCASGVSVAVRRGPTVIPPARALRATRRKRLAAVSAWIVAVVLFISAGGVHWAGIERSTREAREARMAIEPAVREALKVRSDLGELEGRVSRLEELERGRSSTLARLAEISDILPQSAYLMSVRLDTAQLRLDGWSASATALVPVLERQAWAKAVRLAGPVQREHRALGWRERFSVTVDLGPVASDEQTARALP